LPYDIRKLYYSTDCDNCHNHLMVGCLVLNTKNSYGGNWNYCNKCAYAKGYSFYDFKANLPLIDHDLIRRIDERTPYFTANVS